MRLCALKPGHVSGRQFEFVVFIPGRPRDQREERDECQYTHPPDVPDHAEAAYDGKETHEESQPRVFWYLDSLERLSCSGRDLLLYLPVRVEAAHSRYSRKVVGGRRRG